MNKNQRWLLQIGALILARWRLRCYHWWCWRRVITLSRQRVREIDLAQRIVLRIVALPWGWFRIRQCHPTASRGAADIFGRHLSCLPGVARVNIRAQHGSRRFGGVRILLSGSYLASEARLAMRRLSGKRGMLLGSGKDAEEQQKQSNNYRHQQKERFALVAAKLLTSRCWLLLSPRSLERRAEDLTPVSSARLLLLRLLGRYF